MLHSMLRVGNQQRCVDFYNRVLGMDLLRTTRAPDQPYTLAFVGCGGNPGPAEIELTCNDGVEHDDLGTAFGHLAIAVSDVTAGQCRHP